MPSTQSALVPRLTNPAGKLRGAPESPERRSAMTSTREATRFPKQIPRLAAAPSCLTMNLNQHMLELVERPLEKAFDFESPTAWLLGFSIFRVPT